MTDDLLYPNLGKIAVFKDGSFMFVDDHYEFCDDVDFIDFDSENKNHISDAFDAYKKRQAELDAMECDQVPLGISVTDFVSWLHHYGVKVTPKKVYSLPGFTLDRSLKKQELVLFNRYKCLEEKNVDR